MPRMMRGGPRGPRDGMMPFMMMMKGGKMGGMGMMRWMFPLPFMMIFLFMALASGGDSRMLIGFGVCLVMSIVGGVVMFMQMQNVEGTDGKAKNNDTDGIVTGADGKRYIRTEDGDYKEIVD